jgi:hypothetical protein
VLNLEYFLIICQFVLTYHNILHFWNHNSLVIFSKSRKQIGIHGTCITCFSHLWCSVLADRDNLSMILTTGPSKVSRIIPGFSNFWLVCPMTLQSGVQRQTPLLSVVVTPLWQVEIRIQFPNFPLLESLLASHRRADDASILCFWNAVDFPQHFVKGTVSLLCVHLSPSSFQRVQISTYQLEE